jgi:hypothetical protein
MSYDIISSALKAFAEAMKYLDGGMKRQYEEILKECVKYLKLLNEANVNNEDYHKITRIRRALLDSLNLLRGLIGLSPLSAYDFDK